MDNKVNLHYPVPPVQPGKQKNNTTLQTPSAQSDFKEVLQQQLINEKVIKFSGHCVKRMEQSNINFSAGQMEKLTSAVNRAELKGARESLVIMDNLALVISIKNRTVITAVDSQRMKENVFTNIDSAVII